MRLQKLSDILLRPPLCSFEALKRGHLRYLGEVGEGALLDRPDVSSALGEIWLLGIR